MQPAELGAERTGLAAVGRGLQPGELGPGRALLRGHRLQPRLQPGERLAGGRRRLAGGRGVRPVALERPEPGDHRLERRVARLVQLGQAMGEIGGGVRGRGLERAQPRLAGGVAGGLGGGELVEPAAEPLEDRPRLRRLAHLLERAHPRPELVEPGERGLERGVLVADQPEQLPGHRLHALLGGGALGAERLEPRREIRLGEAERLEPPRRPPARAAAGGARAEPRAHPPHRQPDEPRARRDHPRHAADAEALHG